MNTLSVYDTIEQKIKSGAKELSDEEREKLIDIIIDNHAEMITRASDEELMQIASDMGEVR